MTAAASLATSPVLPLLAQREFGIGIALLIVGVMFLGFAIWIFVAMEKTLNESDKAVLAGFAMSLLAIALLLIGLGVARAVAPRGMALGSYVYQQQKAGS